MRTAFGERLAVAQDVEAMRKKLEEMQAGSRLNSLISIDNRLEIERGLTTAIKTGEFAKADLAAMIAERDAYVQNWRAQTSQTLSDASRKLSDARESLNKALLQRQLVELRADRDATVLTIAKISEGSVLQPGEQLITMVPTDAPLEIEAEHLRTRRRLRSCRGPGGDQVRYFSLLPVRHGGGHRAGDQPGQFHRCRPADRPYVPAQYRCRRAAPTPFYRSRIAIDRVDLHDVPANFQVAPGMPVTADIKVGKPRSLATCWAACCRWRRRACANHEASMLAARGVSRMALDRLASAGQSAGRFLADRGGAPCRRLIAAGKPGPAFRLYARATRNGLAEAEYRVGRCYLEGAGVPLSRAEGVRWLEQAGHHGHVEAQSLLAVLYLHGMAASGRRPASKAQPSCSASAKSTDPDYGAAVRWARMAAENGSAEAQAVLAFILTSGPEDMRNLDEADLLVRALGRRGLPAGTSWAMRSLWPAKVATRRCNARWSRSLAKAAEAGLPTALYLLGVVSEHGLGVACDQAAAAQFYRRAAEKGHRPRSAALGVGADARPRSGRQLLRGRNPGCVGRRSPAIRKRRPSLAISMRTERIAAEPCGSGELVPPCGRSRAQGRGAGARPALSYWRRRAARPRGSGAVVPYLPPLPATRRARAELGNLVLKGIGGRGRSVLHLPVVRASRGIGRSGRVVQLRRLPGARAWACRATTSWRRSGCARRLTGVVDAQYWYGRILVEGRGVERDLAQGRALDRARGRRRHARRAGDARRDDAERHRRSARSARCSGLAREGGGERPCRSDVCNRRHVRRRSGRAELIRSRRSAGSARRPSTDMQAAQTMLAPYRRKTLPANRSANGRTHRLQQGAGRGPDRCRGGPRGGSADGSDEALTEGTMKPYQEARCACGSGLRSCRCCDLDPSLCRAAGGERSKQVCSSAGRPKRSRAATQPRLRRCASMCWTSPRVCPAPCGFSIKSAIVRVSSRQQWHCCSGSLRSNPTMSMPPRNWRCCCSNSAILIAAEQHARNAVRLAPANPRSHNLMGMILTEAQRHADRRVSLSPRPGNFRCARPDPVGQPGLEPQGPGQDRRGAPASIRNPLKPHRTFFRHCFGWAQLEEADRDFAAARSRLERAAEIRPDDPGHTGCSRNAAGTRRQSYRGPCRRSSPKQDAVKMPLARVPLRIPTAFWRRAGFSTGWSATTRPSRVSMRRSDGRAK